MGSHWYNTFGENRYGASLTDARTLRYLPSVTTVDKVIANPGLDIWKQNIILQTAMKTPQGNLEDSDYISWVKNEAFAESKRSAKFGNVIHKMAERYVTGKPLFFHGQNEKVWTCFEPLRNWIDENLAEPKGTISQEYGAEVVLVNVFNGYAGKADFFGHSVDGRKILADYKTTNMTARDIKKDGNIRKSKIYDSWGRQLAALRMAAIPDSPDKVVSVIISSNADFPGVWVYEWSNDELNKSWIEFKAALEIFKSQKKL